jgi:hypothetical protein
VKLRAKTGNLNLRSAQFSRPSQRPGASWWSPLVPPSRLVPLTIEVTGLPHPPAGHVTLRSVSPARSCPSAFGPRSFLFRVVRERGRSDTPLGDERSCWSDSGMDFDRVEAREVSWSAGGGGRCRVSLNVTRAPRPAFSTQRIGQVDAAGRTCDGADCLIGRVRYGDRPAAKWACLARANRRAGARPVPLRRSTARENLEFFGRLYQLSSTPGSNERSPPTIDRPPRSRLDSLRGLRQRLPTCALP